MKRTSSSSGAGAGFEVRELRAEDLRNGLLETLQSLSDLEGLTPAVARQALSEMKQRPAGHNVLVAVTSEGSVIGATTLLVERKFIHAGGRVGHIEDVSVRRGHEGKGVGRALVGEAVGLARKLGCYKCILNCDPDLVGFYEKLGFARHDVGMRLDLRPRKQTPRASSRSSGTGT